MNAEDALDITCLAKMLHHGNSGVPNWCRYAFYDAKSFLLKWLAKPDGYDIQNLDRECWDCTKDTVHLCRKCTGTGIYMRRRVWLDRYTLCGYTFHCPVSGVKATGEPTITGLVKHEAYRDSTECAVNIAWLFNRQGLLDAARCAWWRDIPDGVTGPALEAIRRVIQEQAYERGRWADDTPVEIPF